SPWRRSSATPSAAPRACLGTTAATPATGPSHLAWPPCWWRASSCCSSWGGSQIAAPPWFIDNDGDSERGRKLMNVTLLRRRVVCAVLTGVLGLAGAAIAGQQPAAAAGGPIIAGLTPAQLPRRSGRL